MIQIIDVKDNKNIDKFNAVAKEAYRNPEKHGLLVKIYADWCGHCRNMTADWKRLIHELKTNYQCKKPGCVLTIANIQAVNLEPSDPVLQNLKHIPKDIQSIPTIMYVSKGARGLEYSDERVFSNMLKWIVRHEKFALVRKMDNNALSVHHHRGHRHHEHRQHEDDKDKDKSSKRLRNVTKKARIKFKEFHRDTLKQFHKEMRRQHKKSVKSRMPTPVAAIQSSSQQQAQPYVPGYLRED
jgi:thiol-disulfide isomerase/thioredoxin